MAQFSGEWTTTGSPSGDQVSGYTQAHLRIRNRILAACAGEGVAPGVDNELAGSIINASTVQIGTGGGVVDGAWYSNDSPVNNPISAVVGGGTRTDRIVLRNGGPSAFDVSIAVLPGTVGAGAPALTQNRGGVWEDPLWQVTVTSSGVTAIKDERKFAARGPVYRRGGHATNWRTPGTTNYAVGNMIMQVGSAEVLAPNPTVVTFPRQFLDTPLVFVSTDEQLTFVVASSVLNNQFTARAYDPDGTPSNGFVFWMAIGPA
ncbi:MAG TPA: hypothetical protein PKD55_05815 [Bellilinea sp.]|nr:hypothetical protein [Bellilinea sp.]